MKRGIISALMGVLVLFGTMGAAPDGCAQEANLTERKIAPTDLLLISIVGEAGLQTGFRVSSSGTIQFPFIEVVEFYLSAMPAAGWQLVEEPEIFEDLATMAFEKSGVSLLVSMEHDADGDIVSVLVAP